jgi:hypothetical protein
MNKYGLDLGLKDEFDPASVLKLCGSLEEKQTPREWYSEQKSIQKELLQNERFFFYLQKAYAIEDIQASSINGYVGILHSHGENTHNYPEDRLLTSIAASWDFGCTNEVFYDFLKCFSEKSPGERQSQVIISNLHLYSKSLTTPIAELDEGVKNLFWDEAITTNSLLPESKHLERAFGLLANHKGLLEIIRFFNKHNLSVGLSMDNYESFCQRPEEILEKLKMLNSMLGEDGMRELAKRWIENNCPYYDLEVMSKQFNNEGENDLNEVLELMEFDNVLQSRSAYINSIYGKRFKGIPLTEVPRFKEDILIYAITNKKNGFIRLVEENYEEFSWIGSTSILFKREFYAKHININSLSAKNLKDCGWMSASKLQFDELNFDGSYTFEEIKALYNLPIQYYRLYAALEIPAVDKRLIVLKQLTKRKLLSAVTEDEEIKRLAVLLSQKPLSAWREQECAHIVGLKAKDAVKLLIHWDEIQKLVPQMATRTDVHLVTRNPGSAQAYKTLEEMKSDLIAVDEAWRELVKEMNFSEEFLQQNKERVIEFLCNNGADIAHTYYSQSYGGNIRESLKLIVKSVLMGEYKKLKYYADDLCKELEYPVSNAQKSIWSENSEISEPGGIEVKECDDFYSTMQLGVIPQRTCLSYVDGAQKSCLLSGFDSNKKVLFAYKDGEVVGRAIVRLTKGRFNMPKEASEDEPSFSFVDVEAIGDNSNNDANRHDEANDNSEHLILFLERSYSAGITGEKNEFIKGMYVDLLIKKAQAMGALLVVSNSYSTVGRLDDFVQTAFHVFISKSKAGSQYLDSLNGAASVSDEGGYKSNSFFLHRKALK